MTNTLPPGTVMRTTMKLRFYAAMGLYECGEGVPVLLRDGEPVVIYLKGHVPTRLLVHTVSTPHFWAWVWSDILEVPLQEDADDAAL